MALLTNGNANYVTSNATASVIPTGDYMVVVSIISTSTVTAVSGNGITYTLAESNLGWTGSNGTGNTYVYTGSAASPSAGAITITTAAGGKTAWVVSEYNAGAVVQTHAEVISGANPSVQMTSTLPLALGDVGNTVVAAWSNTNYDGYAPGSGWTEEAESGGDEAQVTTNYAVGDQSAEATPNNNWTEGAVILVELGAGTPIASIAQTDTTPEDGVEQTVTCTNMTGPITAATLGGHDIFSLLSGTDPDSPITYTKDISTIETSQSAPRIEQTSTLSFTTATDGAVTTDVVIQPKTGWSFVLLAGTLDKSDRSLINIIESYTGLTILAGDILYYSSANGESISATGVYTGGSISDENGFTQIVIQQGGTPTTPSTSEGVEFYPFFEIVQSASTNILSFSYGRIKATNVL